MHQRAAPGATRGTVSRWVCHCQTPPFLLGTYDEAGRINIKMRDRFLHVMGVVATHCPRCGAEHVLDLRDAQPAAEPDSPT